MDTFDPSEINIQGMRKAIETAKELMGWIKKCDGPFFEALQPTC